MRGVGNLIGSSSPGHLAVKFRLTGRGLAGPPVVTEVREPSARPVGLHLLAQAPAPSPVGGERQFVFVQIVGGGEAADFSLVLWPTARRGRELRILHERCAPRSRIGFPPTSRLRASLSSATCPARTDHHPLWQGRPRGP